MTDEKKYKAGKSYQSYCKPCHNARRNLYPQSERKTKQIRPKKEKKPTGFKALPMDTQNEILKYVGTMPMSKLAKMFDINPHTLRTWKKRGTLIPPN
jgi:hypothetical protein